MSTRRKNLRKVIEEPLHSKLRAALQEKIHAAKSTQFRFALELGLHKYAIQNLFWKGGTASQWKRIATALKRKEQGK